MSPFNSGFRAIEPLPLGFLSLAPTTSSSYPTKQAVASGVPSSRRSSTSVGSRNPSDTRVLKLGPVHWGEHQDDHKEDFHDVAAPTPISPSPVTAVKAQKPAHLPSGFLSLAPTTSASYPTKPVAADMDLPIRRRSSTSSSLSEKSSSGNRVLKLGPVHWGEHQDDHKADFHEI